MWQISGGPKLFERYSIGTAPRTDLLRLRGESRLEIDDWGQMLNPAMLGLIQQFLRQNDITAEAPQQAEVDALQKRLEQKRKARDSALNSQKIVTLNASKEA